MRIALVGGTGDMGMGFSIRWAKNPEIIVGSHNFEKVNKALKKSSTFWAALATFVGLIMQVRLRLELLLCYAYPLSTWPP
jgi:hypothetical protein